MTTILIVVLFVSQLLSFYCIVILNTKLARFKDLEIKQERLMREMEDTIGVYLAEMKDENDRLINELKMVPKQNVILQETNEQGSEKGRIDDQDKKSSQGVNVPDSAYEPRTFIPKKAVVSAYSRQQQSSTKGSKQESAVEMVTEEVIDKQKELSLEEQVFKLSKQGKTVEEIAKLLQKGKTEIELLLKFHY